MTMHPGDHDLAIAVDELGRRLPEALRPLARVAYNYRWSWSLDGADTFAAVDADRWRRVGHNPVRLLSECHEARLEAAAADHDLRDRVARLAEEVQTDLDRPTHESCCTEVHPVAFMCAEFGVHGSLPVYSGGLGVLAGDILKEASDLALPMVGVGLMYRTGYFHQRIDVTGFQHEYWLDTDPDRVPAVRVTGPDGHPLRVQVPLDGADVQVHIWRVDVGRVPLYLLDTDVEDNSLVHRWITSRLYESNRLIRLAQYAVLGVGGVRALAAMGITPGVYHFNEGHPALGLAELVGGRSDDEAWAQVRQQVVFTTHTPVPAGNETYHLDEMVPVLGDLLDLSGDRAHFLGLGRVDPNNEQEPVGLTPLALRSSRSANGVSERHGAVARGMWQPLFQVPEPDDVPITHVTNGVHVPTWLTGPMRELLDRHLGDGWITRADDPATWEPVHDIPAAELWAARTEARRRLVDRVAHRAVDDRLRRGEPLPYAKAPDAGFVDDRLTIGFARRLATYKRLYLISLVPDRAVALLAGDHPVQFVFAGKAHPDDTGAKEVVRNLFQLKGAPWVAGRAAFLEDYDIPLAGELVAGCDVWVNVPRPPLEASGTSGMKSVLNGGLQLSVLDGWWAEAYDGTNGWAIDGEEDHDHETQDRRHAHQLFDLLEQQVIPMFHARTDDGVPERWVDMIRRSLCTSGPRFSATRMVREYAERIYPSC